MKKFAYIVLLFSLFAFIGCASTKNVDLSKVSPIAIITIKTNPEVTMYEDPNDGSGFLTKYIYLRDDESNPISTARLGNIAEAKLLAKLKDNNAFLPKQVVTSVKAYVKQKPSVFKGVNNRVVEGYKFFSENDTQRNGYILKELNAKTGLFITFLFNKTNFNDDREIKNGDMHACVTMNVSLRDIKGKKIYENYFTSISEDIVTVGSNRLEPHEKEEFSKLFLPQMDIVIDEFINNFLGGNNLVLDSSKDTIVAE